MRDISEWMPEDGETVLCGVSGGLDSMTLLHILMTWYRQHAGSVIAAHYNHHLRPAALQDELFVRDWCAQQGITFVSGGGDVQAYAAREGLSVEEAARKLRYAFLRQAAASRDIRRIYVAHHADDNAETILWNFIRGTGLRGLSGMRHEQDGIVRPLLDVPRREVAEYAEAHGVPYVEDETNADPDAASRNFLRLKIMPLLERLNPNASEHMRDAGKRAASLQHLAEDDARRRMKRVEVRDGIAAMPERDILDAPPGLRPVLLQELLDELGTGRKDFGAVHLEAVLHLLGGGNGKRVDLPHGVTAYIRDGWLLLETRPAAEGERVLLPNVPLRWGCYELTLVSDAPAGADGITLRAGDGDRVTVRPCPAGERMTLPGAKGSRTVKRLCLDRRIPLAERDTLPAFYVNDQLAAIWRVGTDTAFVPNGTARRFVKVRQRVPHAP